MPEFSMACPHCRRTLAIPERYLGMRGTCNHCGGSITVRRNDQQPLKAAAEPPAEPTATRSDGRQASSELPAKKPRSPFCPSGWSVRKNTTYGFCFNYPRDWVNIPGIPNIVYHAPDANSFPASEPEEMERIYSPAITLMMAPRGNTAGQAANVVHSALVRLLPMSFQDYGYEREEPFELASGQAAMRMSFTYTKAGRAMESVLTFVVRPQFIFTFDGSSLRNEFDTYCQTFRECLASLQVR